MISWAQMHTCMNGPAAVAACAAVDDLVQRFGWRRGSTVRPQMAFTVDGTRLVVDDATVMQFSRAGRDGHPFNVRGMCCGVCCIYVS